MEQEAWQEMLIGRHTERVQDAFANATVAIIGLGGLGSNIAVLLARMGIGKLILIDYDRVELSNLHRQQYYLNQIGEYKTEALANTLQQINPYIVLELETVELNASNASALLQAADIVCEAMDGAESKSWLVDYFISHWLGVKVLIAASGMAGIGNSNAIVTKRLAEGLYVCGDGYSSVEVEKTLFASRVALCAAHQANLVVELLKEKIKEDE